MSFRRKMTLIGIYLVWDNVSDRLQSLEFANLTDVPLHQLRRCCERSTLLSLMSSAKLVLQCKLTTIIPHIGLLFFQISIDKFTRKMYHRN